MKRLIPILLIVSTFLAFAVPSPAYATGIAENNASDYVMNTGVSNQTFSYSFGSGANRFANICIIQGQGANTDVVTSVTVNGVTAPRIATVAGANDRIYDYGLVAPSTGTQNVVVNFTSSIGGWVFIADYSGVTQSDSGTGGNPSNFNVNTSNSATTLGVNLTTGSNNSWVIGCAGNNAAQIAVDKGVLRKNDLNVARANWDSNGVISPAGAYNVTWSDGGATAEWQAISIEIKAVVIPSTFSFWQFADF